MLSTQHALCQGSRSCFGAEPRLRASARSTPRPGQGRRCMCPPLAVGWDPENVLSGPQEGHIARRQYQKKLQADAAFLQQVW